jgi:hypothetical protein
VPVLSLACSSGLPPEATQNQVFYDYRLSSVEESGPLETPYPPLDLAKQGGAPAGKGVVVLGGIVALSRPVDWVVRSGSRRPGARYVQYVSPSQYVFSLYERSDPPEATWREVFERYEAELLEAKARVVSRAVPTATFNAQGREYVVRRTVPTPGVPFVNLSREILVRTDRRVVLVQIVHQGDTVQAISGDLRRALETLRLR